MIEGLIFTIAIAAIWYGYRWDVRRRARMTDHERQQERDDDAW
jgi:hypothetical protein